MCEAGKFNTDFLSASNYAEPACAQYPNDNYSNYYDPWCEEIKHEGYYTELQVGPAPSQMHTFPLPRKSSFQWTEWFKASADMPVSKLQAADYYGPDGPVATVEGWLQGSEGMTQSKFEATDKFLAALATTPPKPEDMMAWGSPWGALHEMASGQKLAPGCPFTPKGGEGALLTDPLSRPWAELLKTGTFSKATVSTVAPMSYQTGRVWEGKLQASVAAGHASWLHSLHLGTIALERGNAAQAEAHFQQSMKLRPSAIAARNLAVMAPDANTSFVRYQTAWTLWKSMLSGEQAAKPETARLATAMAGEMAVWMAATEHWATLRTMLADIAKLCPACQRKDKVLDAESQLAVQDGDWDKALKIITSNCFPTYAEYRRTLIATWWQALLLREQHKLGRPLSILETVHLRRRVGCDGDHSGLTYESPCKRGPPNIGCAPPPPLVTPLLRGLTDVGWRQIITADVDVCLRG